MPTVELLNERDLLLQVADGSQSAYKKIFTFYWDHIYSVALKFTKSAEISQDLTQDVFAQVWIKRERLREVLKFDAYLFITARNLIINRLRKDIFTTKHESRLLEYFSDPGNIPSRAMELKEMETIIQSGISHLPRQQQTAFCLSRFEGLKHEEIALRMGISRQSVKSHIVRAISSLKKYVSTQTAQLLFFILLAIQ